MSTATKALHEILEYGRNKRTHTEMHKTWPMFILCDIYIWYKKENTWTQKEILEIFEIMWNKF